MSFFEDLPDTTTPHKSSLKPRPISQHSWVIEEPESNAQDDLLGGTEALLCSSLEEKIQEILDEVEMPSDIFPEGQNSRIELVNKRKNSNTTNKNTNTLFAHTKSWGDFSLNRRLLKCLIGADFQSPTSVQCQVIPPALSGSNLVVTAPTGSGKTLSFLTPVLNSLFTRYSKVSVPFIYATVIVPTRELGGQAYSMMKKLLSGEDTPFNTFFTAGGYSVTSAASTLRNVKPHIVFATPGRLVDLIKNYEGIDISTVEVFIIDEGDRMVEMGFIEEVNYIADAFCQNKHIQYMTYSATKTKSVESELNRLFQKKAIYIDVNNENIADNKKALEVLSINPNILQTFVKLRNEEDRMTSSVSLLRKFAYPGQKIVCFFESKIAAHQFKSLCLILFNLSQFAFFELHGNLSQSDRSKQFNQFQAEGNQQLVHVLIATDVASRGLDFSNISFVLNFSIPREVRKYIHRVGRSGRIGLSGESISLFSKENPTEYKNVKDICRKYSTKNTTREFKLNEEDMIVSTEQIKWFYEQILPKLQSLESSEKSLRKSSIEANSARNKQKYQEDIASRPKKSFLRKRKIDDHDGELKAKKQASKEKREAVASAQKKRAKEAKRHAKTDTKKRN